MPVAADNSDHARETVESLSTEILTLLGKASEQFDGGATQSWRWFEEHGPDASLVEILRDSTPTALRVLGAIGELEPSNGATISERYKVPKGTVSKVTRRLMAQGLVISETLPNNKKEVLFRLTPPGKQLNALHQQFDNLMASGFRRFLRRYSPDELRLLIRILQDVSEVSFLDLGIQETREDER